MALWNQAKTATAAVQRGVETILVVILRLVHSEKVLYAMTTTKNAAQAVNSPRKVRFADLVAARAIRRKCALERQAIVRRTGRRRMARAVVMACNVHPDSVRAAICNAKPSWVLIRKATTRMPVTVRVASLAVQALSLAMACAMVFSRTSWTGLSAVEAGIVRM